MICRQPSKELVRDLSRGNANACGMEMEYNENMFELRVLPSQWF